MMSMTHQRWIKWYAVICAVAAMLTAASLPAAAAEEHLIAYYSFEDAGNLGKDDSGSGNDLTAVGKGGASSGEGVKGQALYLDGESGLAAKETDGVDFSDGLTSFTISFYAKHDGFVGIDARVISSGYNGTQDGFNIGLGRYMDSEVHLVYQPLLGDEKDHWGKMSEFCQVRGAEVNEWHHYVAVYNADSRTMSAYIDGELKAEDSYQNPPMKSELNFCIGGSWGSWFSSVMYGFEGGIDEVRIYDAALQDLSALGIGGGTTSSSETTVPSETTASSEPDTTSSAASPGSSAAASTTAAGEKVPNGNNGWIIWVVVAVVVIAAAGAAAVILMKKKRSAPKE